MAGLRRGRVDLDHGIVEVVEIVTEVSGYLHFGPPKTQAGYRRVGLPRVVVEALAEQLARPGSADDLVFVGPQGGTLLLAGFRHRIWRPATRAAELMGCASTIFATRRWRCGSRLGRIPRRSPPGPATLRSASPWTATATSIPTPIRRSGTAWMPCMRTPRHASPKALTDQRRTRRPARGPKTHLSHRRTGGNLRVWLVGVAGLEPAASSL
jgi:hypothetical protein